eukprot:TRINITY_DN41_c1_g1_i1.p1 TRINITY_DN41_c1_g1~~TRINITY_DN41_c1_g1_i1.p1  ORF type:complete len:1105 (+),score=282.47 TRINITY_DN41_c1_g1_i1:439-3315(+)
MAREPECEEYASSLFVTLLRHADFGKAQQVATKVYRKFNKPHYLQWVIAAILLGVRAGGPVKSLDLAAMMLQKAPINMEALKSSDKPFDRGQLYLCLLHLSTLQMQRKQEPALELLEACKPLVKLSSDATAFKVQLLCEAGRLQDAVREAKAQVLSEPGSWASVQDYARLVFDLDAPAGTDVSQGHSARLRPAETFPTVTSLADLEQHGTKDEAWNALLLLRHFQQVQETSNSGVNRVAFLGELELRRAALARTELERSEPPGANDLSDLVDVMEAFIKKFGGRTHCFFDLKPYLSLLTAADAAPLQKIAASAATEKGRESTVLAARLRRAFRRHGSPAAEDTSAAGEAAEASELLETWASFGGGKVAEGETSNMATEVLLQLAVVAIMEADRDCCRESKAADRRYLLDAIALAELGLRENPHAFCFKVLLLLLHAALGLPGQMLNVFGGMDIKNIQHESLSYLVLDVLSVNGSLEPLREVCRNIQGFHEDLDKDGNEALGAAFHKGVLPRAPEYVDSIAQVSQSLMWGRAVVEETASDVGSATSWDSLVEVLGRRHRILSFIAGRPTEHWVLRNQDRALLNGLQPLQLLRPVGGMSASSTTQDSDGSSSSSKLRVSPRFVSSFAMAWGGSTSAAGPPPAFRRGERGAAEELLHLGQEGAPAAQLRLLASMLQLLGLLVHRDGPTEDLVSQAIDSARSALGELFSPGKCPEVKDVAARFSQLLAEDSGSSSSCWSGAVAEVRALSLSCGFAACEAPALVLRCCSGKEAWERVAERFDALSAAVSAIGNCLHQAPGGNADFAPPPRRAESCPARPFCLGCFGVPWLWSLLSGCLSVLIPSALWCSTALPKAGAGKKVKEGQEALHASRVALRNLLQALQATLGDLQADLSGAEALLPTPAEECKLPEVAALAVMPEVFAQLRKEAGDKVLDSHRKQLKMLNEALGQKILLLKSRGAFKP